MTLRLAEGFDKYGATSGNAIATIGRHWTLTSSDPSNDTVPLIAGRYAGQAIKLSSMMGGLSIARSGITLGGATKLFVGFNVKSDSGSGGYAMTLSFGTNTSLNINHDGSAVLTIAGTTHAVTLGAITGWKNIELVLCPGGSAATQIFVDEVSVYSATETWTYGGTFTWDVTGSATIAIDDFYVLDNAGTTGNARLGKDARVSTLFPSADTSVEEWSTVGTVNAFDAVDNVPDDATKYVKGTTDGQRIVFDFTNLATTPAVVAGVVLSALASNLDGGDERDLKLIVDISGTPTEVGSVSTPATTVSGHQTILATDPSTSAAWAYAGVNALKAGLKVKTHV